MGSATLSSQGAVPQRLEKNIETSYMREHNNQVVHGDQTRSETEENVLHGVDHEC